MKKILEENRIEWFMSYVTPEPNTGCWLWTGCCNPKGYGCCNPKGYGSSCGILAHRVSYRLFRGEIPCDMHVLHDCDTPGCVNPNHLHLGTDKDNARERDSKNRRKVPKGEANWSAGITDKQAESVRQLRLGGYKLETIEAITGVHYSTIRRILYALGRFQAQPHTYLKGMKHTVASY